MAAVVSDDRMLVTGGVKEFSDRTAKVRRAVINPADGTLGSWIDVTAMPEPRAYHSAVMFNGNLFVAGGETGETAVLDDVIAAPLDAFADVGTWRFTKRLSRPLMMLGLLEANGNLYAIGGGVVGNYVNNVEYSPLEAP